MFNGLEEVISYSSFDLEVDDDQVLMNGYTKQIDSIPSFFNVFKEAGKGRMLAQEALPHNTAMFMSIRL